jgi:hypothetical protein
MAGWKEAKELLELLPKEKTELLNYGPWAIACRRAKESRARNIYGPWAIDTYGPWTIAPRWAEE